MAKNSKPLVLDLSEVGAGDVQLVGGKCASLGELFRALVPRGVRAVDGFATTSEAYRLLLETNGLGERLRELMEGLDHNDIRALNEAGREARALMLDTPLPPEVDEAIKDAYRRLCERVGHKPEVAVRSSATAEDLPDASFAGQQDTILNVRGEDHLIEACHRCFASLWTDRAISYRAARGFDHFEVALSIGVQPMVRSDQACSGVMFSLDTESGFRDVVVINGAWGLGEAIVQGMATPDEWVVFKPTLQTGARPIVSRRLGTKEVKMVYGLDGRGTRTREVVEAQRKRFCLSDYEVLELARWACLIEEHYSELAGKSIADGHRVGQGRTHRRALHSSGTAGNGARHQWSELYRDLPTDRRTCRTSSYRHRRRREDQPWPRSRACRSGSPGRVQGRRCAGNFDDGSRVGANHEKRCCDRDRSRRPNLSQRDHQPRTGPSLHCRHGKRNAGTAKRRRSYCFMC